MVVVGLMWLMRLSVVSVTLRVAVVKSIMARYPHKEFTELSIIWTLTNNKSIVFYLYFSPDQNNELLACVFVLLPN